MTNTATTTKTPGYSTRLGIWFKTDRRGRPTAWYFSTGAGRAVRLPLTDAQMWIAQDQADQLANHPLEF